MSTTIIEPTVSDGEWTQNPSGNTILFPEVRQWEQVIAEAIIIGHREFMSGKWEKPARLGYANQLFCSIERRGSPFALGTSTYAVVSMKPEVWATTHAHAGWPRHWTWPNGSGGQHAAISLKAIEWVDGRTLIVATDSVIWAGTWVAFVTPESVPGAPSASNGNRRVATN
jgi:hypothetical protein